jgi:hypothetical protein
VERSGATLHLSFRTDGTAWEQPTRQATLNLALPRKLKVGVIGEATAPGAFRPVFDRFKLTLKRPRPAAKG